MQIKPNNTVISGKILAIKAEPDGFGAEITVKVTENNSPDPNQDFIKTKSGETLNLFSTEPEKLEIGDDIEAHAILSAGPFGGRNVLAKAKKLS